MGEPLHFRTIGIASSGFFFVSLTTFFRGANAAAAEFELFGGEIARQ
jgi:hypothetical protein